MENKQLNNMQLKASDNIAVVETTVDDETKTYICSSVGDKLKTILNDNKTTYQNTVTTLSNKTYTSTIRVDSEVN